MSADDNKGLFREINPDDDDPEITEIESYCFNCEEQGITKLFLTKIPFFKEVIVSSFTCDHCQLNNSELQPAGRIQDRGVKYQVKVTKPEDLNRQVVQTNSATVSIPELQFENPPSKGALTTIEGIIDRAVEGLGQDQIIRRIQHPEVAEQIDQFIEKLKGLKTCDNPFHMIIDDPSGNSFIENPYAPKEDPQLTTTNYRRTAQQNETLGLNPVDDIEEETKFNAKDEVLTFPTNCPNCNAPVPTHMKMLDIPHFKEVVVMATNCDACGIKESEIKSGGGIEPQGKKITLKLTDSTDLSRDVLKGEWALVAIPELDFSTKMSSMPGKFTTVEGLLDDLCTQALDDFSTKMSSMPGKFTTVEGLLDDLCTQIKRFHPFVMGDSSTEEKKRRIDDFCDKINKIKSGETLNVHVVLDDPTGNSYLQNLYAPDPDPEMTVELYDRTDEQNEEMGLNDIKVENYSES